MFLSFCIHMHANATCRPNWFWILCTGDSFDFEALAAIKSRDAFIHLLPTLSQTSKKYFALSSQYFDTKGLGDVELIRDLTSFASPEEMGGFDLNIQAPTISFTSWIRTTPQFVSGYLIRKRPSQTSDLSCWGWFLDSRFPNFYTFKLRSWEQFFGLCLKHNIFLMQLPVFLPAEQQRMRVEWFINDILLNIFQVGPPTSPRSTWFFPHRSRIAG